MSGACAPRYIRTTVAARLCCRGSSGYACRVRTRRAPPGSVAGARRTGRPSAATRLRCRVCFTNKSVSSVFVYRVSVNHHPRSPTSVARALAAPAAVARGDDDNGHAYKRACRDSQTPLDYTMSSCTTVPVSDSEKATNNATRQSLMEQSIDIQFYLLHTTSLRFSTAKAMRMRYELKFIAKQLASL